jgi:glycosyltransferase involved in cell wall biosynthesis
MKPVPICLRTRNRPVYLDCTLKSLWASDLPEDVQLCVMDDCSDDALTRQYLFTNDEIVLPQPHIWPNSLEWQTCVGALFPVKKLKGIQERVEVVQPTTRKGVRGGIFYCIDYMFSRHIDHDEIIVIEADSLFHKDWYAITMDAYFACRNLAGPNGSSLGLLSCYDRKGSDVHRNGWGWRSVKPLSGGRWGCGNGIGGVMYLVTRSFYNAAHKAMKATYDPSQRSGDTMLQAQCGIHKYNIAVTVPTMCQHIGVESLAWPEKGWRHATNFRRPFAFESFDHGIAFSGDWL